MLEKVITLENISLVDFLGIQNQNIKEIASAFPESKIISRGNEIRIQGTAPQILKINDILNSLLSHYNRFGKVTHENVVSYINEEQHAQAHVGANDVLVFGTRGFKITPKTTNQKALVKAVDANDLVFAIGPAGTGKTYISVALAVRALKNKEVKKIIITRPAVEAGENLGFLPGDLKEKIDPYLRPIYDALNDMIPSEKLRYYRENGVIEIAPLAYMRGRTLNNAYVLLDEAQNTTPMQIKMFLTRMGPDSKVIITGDRSQVDLPRNQKSGLMDALNVLKGINGIGFVELDEKDVVRHKLVKDIVRAYNKSQEKS
ncbi:PhoH family protein [Marinoscillum furvescens]|uniref:PhoH-like protein n=1 Tax=Marinoscillum furvescens DSM 4134 TaxID=1122208 RepID=A0A3D9L307_MARFU|nr:PhoH family protein [Marinoscillum furvescens]RED97041.1 phosphate starvation-inducible protein PhoH [Marinoscillum furvescens DSM 4134]